MNAFPFMPLFWNDFLSDNKVRVMSNEELGAYFRLLGAAWHEDIPGTLPADDDVLARLAGAELSLWRKLSRRILPCFTLNEQAGRYEQKRMMAEHAKVAAQTEMKHARATAGAEKRWGKKPEQSPSNAQAMLKHEPSIASHNQSQKKDIPEAKASSSPAAADDRTEPGGVIASFHSLCPSLPKVRDLTEQRKTAIRARWKASGGRGLEWFRELFAVAEASDYLTGRNGKWAGCAFDWLLNPTNAQKVLEGNYNNDREKPNAHEKHRNPTSDRNAGIPGGGRPEQYANVGKVPLNGH